MSFTPLHRALGIEPGPLDADLVETAVANHVVESGDLEWKDQLPDKRDPKNVFEIAKDVAAQANTGGGLLIYGVREDGEDRAAAITGIDDPRQAAQRIRTAAYNQVSPPITGVALTVITTSSGDVLVVRVPASREAPHLSQAGGGSWLAPRRDGSHTVFMSERDLERAYVERFTANGRAEHHLSRLYDERAQAPLGRYVNFVGVAVPHEPRLHNAHGIDAETAHGVLSDARRQPFYSPSHIPGGFALPDPTSKLRRGLRRWVITETEERRIRSVEVHFDGTVALVSKVDGNLTTDTADIGKIPCMRVEGAIADLAALITASARRLGLSGYFDVRVGLVPGPTASMELLAPDYSPVGSASSFEALRATLPGSSSEEAMLVPLRDLARDAVNQFGFDSLTILKEEQAPSV